MSNVCICDDMGRNGHGFSCPQREKAKRIFDDPGHPNYGPVRRMWVILAGLGMLDTAEEWGNRQHVPWDRGLDGVMRNGDLDETTAKRWLLRHLLKEG